MKTLRAYIITAIICISITTIVACIFIADESARRITLGDKSTVIVFGSNDEPLDENEINPLPVIEKIKDGAKKAAEIAPPPISNIYWFFVNFSEK